MPAIFGVDPRSGVPIYLQLIEQVTRAIALGTLTPGEKLPTVKALALELIVNPTRWHAPTAISNATASFRRAPDGGRSFVPTARPSARNARSA